MAKTLSMISANKWSETVKLEKAEKSAVKTGAQI